MAIVQGVTFAVIKYDMDFLFCVWQPVLLIVFIGRPLFAYILMSLRSDIVILRVIEYVITFKENIFFFYSVLMRINKVNFCKDTNHVWWYDDDCNKMQMCVRGKLGSI